MQIGERQTTERELADVRRSGVVDHPRIMWDDDFADEVERVWGRRWGAMSDLGQIELVMVSRPGEEELRPDVLEYKKQGKGFLGPVSRADLQKSQQELDGLAALLGEGGAEVIYLDLPPDARGAYAPYPGGVNGVRDLVILNGGAIIPRMGVDAKRGAEVYWAKKLVGIGCPILYTVHGRGTFEGGNVCWIDSKHVLVGISLRTNPEGLRQVEPLFRMAGVEDIQPVYLPSYLEKPLGYHSHLDLAFGMVDRELALIFPPGIDWVTLEHLKRLGIELIEVPYEEVMRVACNALATSPGKVLMPKGNSRTVEALVKRNVEVREFEWEQHIIGNGPTGGHGGPVCWTAPLIRRPL